MSSSLIIPQNLHFMKWVFQVLWHETVHSKEAAVKTPSYMDTTESLTYCTGELASPLLEQSHDLSFLRRSTSAAHNSRALASQLHELILIVFETHLIYRDQKRHRCLCYESFFYRNPIWPQCNGQRHLEPTSSESPEITRAQSCFRRKAFSSRWASPRLVTWGKR